MTPNQLQVVLGAAKVWRVVAQANGKPVVNTFDAGDALDAKVYRGDGQSVVMAPSVSWDDPAAGSIRLAILPSQTEAARVSAGVYRIEVGVTPASDGVRRGVLYGTVHFLGTSGSEAPPDSLVSWEEVLTYSSDVQKLEQQDVDQTQFSGQRAEAMGLFVQEVARRYNPRPGGSRRYLDAAGTGPGPYLRPSPSPDGSPPPTRGQVEAWLSTPGRLRVTRDVIEANARLAAALVYGSAPGANNPYQQMADKERALARDAVRRAVIEIDTKDEPDGNPTVRVDRDVVYLT